MNEKICLDLIICTYNNSAFLERVLKTICEQKNTDNVNCKVLVVNNNCTDNTKEVVKKYSSLIKYPLHMVMETTQGLTPARLWGVKQTTGDWIAFVDDDCFLSEDWIEQVAEFAAKHSNCGAFGGKVILDWETPPIYPILNYGWCFAEQDLGNEAVKTSCLVGAGLIINRAALTNTGWIEKQFLQDRIGDRLISGGDVEIGLRIGARYELWYNPKCQLKHRIPIKRTSVSYVQNMNYSLGVSKLLGDSLLWEETYFSWFCVSAIKGVRDATFILIRFTKAKIRRESTLPVKFDWSFLSGWWAGIWQVFLMKSDKRKQLLGSALLSD